MAAKGKASKLQEAIAVPNAFEGHDISQTYEEREAAKKEKLAAKEEKEEIKEKVEVKPADENLIDKETNIKADEGKKWEKRVTLYISKKMYSQLSLIANAEQSSMNQIAIAAIKDAITPERISAATKRIAMDLEALQDA